MASSKAAWSSGIVTEMLKPAGEADTVKVLDLIEGCI